MIVRFDLRADHLHAVVEGAFEPQLAHAQLLRMLQACTEKGVTRIFIDARGITSSVSIAERFDIAAQLAARGPPLIRIAILVSPEKMFTKTLEEVAVDRGAQVKTTDSLEEAIAYLGIAAG